MGRKGVLALTLVIAAFLGLGYLGSPEGEAVIPQPDRAPRILPSFSRDIQPVLQGRCVACHSSAAAAGGLDLTDYEGVMDGSTFGPMVLPGNPDQSNLLAHLKREVDPRLWQRCNLKGLSPTSSLVKDLKRWIAQGARNN